MKGVAVPRVDSPRTTAEYRRIARRAKLRYVVDSQPGFRRQPHGRGFRYVGRNGRTIHSRQLLERIRALAIPPAWTDVWISPQANAHLQCTGRDARGRKQYLYHARWQAAVIQLKYNRLAGFGRVLPRLRRRVLADLRRRGWPREKACALAVAIIDATALRVGNAEYLRDNDSRGLTTLERRHVQIGRGRLVFHFHGKSGQRQTVELHSRRLTRLLGACSRLRGPALLKYQIDGGTKPLDAADVNEYLAELTAGSVTAKDFRTWHATKCVLEQLQEGEAPDTLTARRRRMKAAISAAAEMLGNTPAVCRQSYVHTGLMDSYLNGEWPTERPASSARRGKRLERSLLRRLKSCA